MTGGLSGCKINPTAGIAQLAERITRNDEAHSSILCSGTKTLEQQTRKSKRGV